MALGVIEPAVVSVHVHGAYKFVVCAGGKALNVVLGNRLVRLVRTNASAEHSFPLGLEPLEKTPGHILKLCLTGNANT